MPPAMKANISAVNVSTVPSDLIKEYLSTSNAEKVSFVPAVTFADSWFPEILTVNVFLIFNIEFEISTLETLIFGSFVYKVLSSDDSKLVLITFKSVTSKEDVDGKREEVTPDTVWILVTSISVVPTLTILAKTGSGRVVSV